MNRDLNKILKIVPIPIRKYLLLLFLLLFFVCLKTKAQDKNIKFRSINSAGLLLGEGTPRLILQTINGIAYNKFYSGIGIGVDYYNYKSYPLFFDQRIYFGYNGKAFGYGDLGYNFSSNPPGKYNVYYGGSLYKGGIYSDLGFGYRTRFIKHSFLIFEIGLSYKQLQRQFAIGPDCNGCQPDLYYEKFGDAGIILKAGVAF